MYIVLHDTVVCACNSVYYDHMLINIILLLFPDEVACIDPEICNYVCQSRAGCTSIAYPRLVLGVMPEGNTKCTLSSYMTAPCRHKVIFM